jgi:hypothetical protein
MLGEVNIYGGSFDSGFGYDRVLNAVGAGQIKIYGGAFTDYSLLAQQNGSISIYGSNFAVDSQAGLISGILQNAQSFSMNYQIYGSGSINLVSASNTQRLTSASADAPVAVPAPPALFGMGAAFAWSRRLRKRLARAGGATGAEDTKAEAT